MRSKFLALAAVSLLPLASQYSRADFDFSPKVVGGQIATGGHDDEAGVDVADLRTGTFAFGENAGDPFNTGDPGFNSNGATSFTAGTQLRLAPLAVQGSFLRYWNGNGTPNFGAVPGSESVQLSGSPTRSVTYRGTSATISPATDTSLLIGNFASNGAIHVHLTSTLAENNVSYDPVTGTPVNIPAGNYLVSFKLVNPGTGIADSKPLFIVYNNNLSDDQTDAAVAYVNRTYAAVPEPATLGGLAVGGLLLGRRRRAR